MPSPNQRQFEELVAYLVARRESGRAFALRAGIDKSVLSRLLNGRIRYVDPGVAAKIAIATDGQVGHVEVAEFQARLAAAGAPRGRGRGAAA